MNYGKIMNCGNWVRRNSVDDQRQERSRRTPRSRAVLFAAIAGAIVLAGGSETSAAENLPADKSRYHLFNPTPRELMRELSTDRPDKTETAYTVDAGHFQIEMDIFSYSYDKHNPEFSDTTVESLAIAPMNLKLGVLNNVDLQFIVEPYVSVRTHERDGVDRVERRRGFGDLTVRSKINLWGNDSGATALAVMPFVKIPTNQDDLGNNSVEGGIILPLSASLPYGWGMGVMTEVDFIRDELGDGHHAEFVNTIAFGRDIIGNLAGFIEFFSLVSAERDSDWVGTVDVGFTYLITPDIQLDGGVNLGVTRAAEDVNPFVGLSWRF